MEEKSILELDMEIELLKDLIKREKENIADMVAIIENNKKIMRYQNDIEATTGIFGNQIKYNLEQEMIILKKLSEVEMSLHYATMAIFVLGFKQVDDTTFNKGSLTIKLKPSILDTVKIVIEEE